MGALHYEWYHYDAQYYLVDKIYAKWISLMKI
jgi:hypothetical protein